MRISSNDKIFEKNLSFKSRSASLLKRLSPGLLFLFVPLLLFPDPALATQTHGDPEGLLVHQLSHFFFIVSLGVFLFWIKETGLSLEKEWRFIAWYAFLLIAWNLDAFLVHLIDEQTHLLDITKGDFWTLKMTARQGYEYLAYLYYIVKMDHLLCVPAMFVLFLGLKRLNKRYGEKKRILP